MVQIFAVPYVCGGKSFALGLATLRLEPLCTMRHVVAVSFVPSYVKAYELEIIDLKSSSVMGTACDSFAKRRSHYSSWCTQNPLQELLYLEVSAHYPEHYFYYPFTSGPYSHKQSSYDNNGVLCLELIVS
jgi:hypothetical protein